MEEGTFVEWLKRDGDTINVGAIVAISEVEELNIGHNIVARAVLVGLDRAVREMREAMRQESGIRSQESVKTSSASVTVPFSPLTPDS